MSSIAQIKSSIIAAFDNAKTSSDPYQHWTLSNVLPQDAVEELLKHPLHDAPMDYAEGERATNNEHRVYFGADYRAKSAVVDAISAAFQSPEVVGKIARLCKTDLEGKSLRIEYTQDKEGFWLKPHTDIGAKFFTMLIYLSSEPESEDWGTSIYSDPETFHSNVRATCNSALVFIPATDTWHGFEPRIINGTRKSLIINYVTEEWRARHELAFPEQPVVLEREPA